MDKIIPIQKPFRVPTSVNSNRSIFNLVLVWCNGKDGVVRNSEVLVLLCFVGGLIFYLIWWIHQNCKFFKISESFTWWSTHIRRNCKVKKQKVYKRMQKSSKWRSENSLGHLNRVFLHVSYVMSFRYLTVFVLTFGGHQQDKLEYYWWFIRVTLLISLSWLSIS